MTKTAWPDEQNELLEILAPALVTPNSDDLAVSPRAFDEDAADAEEEEDDEDDFGGGSGSDAVYPWVAGFAAAMEHFPALMRLDEKALSEPLALLYRHLDPDDLEDADELLELIESLEPPADISESVEGLVRATLLMADLSRPIANPTKHPMRRGPPPPRRR